MDERNDAVLSVVSAWEIIVKVRSGKLEVVGEADDYVRSRVAQIGVRVLSCTLDHVLAVNKLPALHHDPFDRLLVAQATIEGLALMSSDEVLRAYDIEWIDARV